MYTSNDVVVFNVPCPSYGYVAGQYSGLYIMRVGYTTQGTYPPVGGGWQLLIPLIAGGVGPAGPAGDAGAVGDAGPAGVAGSSVVWRADWSQNTMYTANDVVAFNVPGPSYGYGAGQYSGLYIMRVGFFGKHIYRSSNP